MSAIQKIAFWIACAAAALALGIFLFVSKAPAYAGTAAATCNNCHVMDSQYENWYHGGHAQTATCVECHLPHDNLIAYYLAKGKTGMHDVFVFSTGQTPVLIRANSETRTTVQANCIRCHSNTVQDIIAGPQAFDRNCWDCHRTAAHGDRGLSAVPFQDTAFYSAK